MNNIILSQNQKDFFLNFKNKFHDLLSSRNVDIIPIEIKNNLWVLPQNVLNDDRYLELREDLKNQGLLSELIIREVRPEELIEPDI